MGRRRMLPSRDLPVRACTVAQCQPEPRRRSLAAFAVFANSLGAVAAAFGRQATGRTPTCTGAERRIRGMFNQSLSGQGPLNASLDTADVGVYRAGRRISGGFEQPLSGEPPLTASLDAAARPVEGDLRDHGYYPPPC